MRKWIAVILAAVLLLTLFSGCKAKNEIEFEIPEEESGDQVPEKEEETPDEKEPAPQKPSKDEPEEEKQPEEEPEKAPEKDEPTSKEPEVETPEEESPEEEEPEEEEEEPEEEAPQLHYKEENKLKLVSYNVRSADDPDGNSIKERAPRMKQVLEDYDPDVIGFQEVVPKWMNYLPKDLAEYDYILQYRAAKSREGTPIFWKRDKFELVDKGYFWLSDTPERESKGWGADYYRICTWVKLKVKATGAEFIFMSTHLDFDEIPQTNSVKLMIKKAKAMGGFSKLPVFCVGDFNLRPMEIAYIEMESSFADLNTQLEDDQTATSTGKYTGTSNDIIDYIFTTPGMTVPLKYKVMTDLVEGKYVSDHFGVYGEVALADPVV